jgi:hypothetical protein
MAEIGSLKSHWVILDSQTNVEFLGRGESLLVQSNCEVSNMIIRAVMLKPDKEVLGQPEPHFPKWTATGFSFHVRSSNNNLRPSFAQRSKVRNLEFLDQRKRYLLPNLDFVPLSQNSRYDISSSCFNISFCW